MKDTKDLEYQIFACIMLNNKLIDEYDLDEKYFRNKSILNYLTDVYRRYGSVDAKILMYDEKNEKAMHLVCEFMEYEVSWKSVYGYYKQLKETFRNNNIELITTKFKNKQINYAEFTKEMFDATKEDFDEEELLAPSDISNVLNIEREYTYIDELDYLLKGFEYGKLNLFSGITNHGKTTLMIQFAKNFIKRHKQVFYFSGEQTAEEFKNYLYVGMCQKHELEFVEDEHNKRIYDARPKQELIEYYDNIYKDDFVVYNNSIIQNDINKMMKVMKKAFNQGTRIFFIDNFMQLDNSEMLEEQTKIVEQFKRFAMMNKCIVCLVAHPRKTQFMKNRLTIFDIAGTQNIVNKSTNICTIMRTDAIGEQEYDDIGKALLLSTYDIKECDAVVEVIKTKGNACKMVGLKYDRELKIYIEAKHISKEDAEQRMSLSTKKRKSDYYD